MAGPPLVNIKALRELIEMLVEHGIAEFEYRQGDLRIRIVHGPSTARTDASREVPAWLLPILQSLVQRSAGEAPEAVPNNPHPQPTAVTSAPAPAAEEAAEAEQEGLHVIRSPIVGTFYRAPAPDAPPFVEVGDHVHKGQTVCIVEAMKIMNEIQADVDGEVVAIYVANGAPVEYGQELLAIRPVQE